MVQRDWCSALRVHFKNRSNIYCCFDVKVLACQDDLSFTTAPLHLSACRGVPGWRPRGTTRASSLVQGELSDLFTIQDLSIGGMRCCGTKKLAEGAPLTEISLCLPARE
jgi:hypothetical protein